MSTTAISVEGLGKRYVLGHRHRPTEGLRHVLHNKLTAPFRPREAVVSVPREFWALRDVSFAIPSGEVVGIVGRNGAGKSTLLKILSRITEPTSGRVVIEGRVASLLEVGTGFHPELTGRENVYLNGAILGMKRSEIRARFDEIVAFAEVKQFLDTPVKRYSSGMYVRLAFAVAAHLHPEILIVDEVLAVGDAQFQQKCLGKMGDVARGGRTVLFVSHNMAAVRALCRRAVLLEAGMVEFDGPVTEAIRRYQHQRVGSEYVAPAADEKRARIRRISFGQSAEQGKDPFRTGEPVSLVIELANPHGEPLEVYLAFYDASGMKLWKFAHADSGLPPLTTAPAARARLTFQVPAIAVPEVFVHVGLRVKGQQTDQFYVDHVGEGLRFLVQYADTGSYRASDTVFECPVTLEALLQ